MSLVDLKMVNTKIRFIEVDFWVLEKTENPTSINKSGFSSVVSTYLILGNSVF
jgi:hypothetical protein